MEGQVELGLCQHLLKVTTFRKAEVTIIIDFRIPLVDLIFIWIYICYMSNVSDISHLALSHGQVLSTIEGMHIVEWLNRPALDSILKKFRREGVPDFSSSGQSGRQGADFIYRYEELMDCVVAMKLVADGLAFRYVSGLMQFDRKKLHEHYRAAYLQAESGRGKLLKIKCSDGRKINISGLYLDFHASISKTGVLSTPGPRLLDPWEALNRYMGFYQGWHVVGLVRLSQLATEAVRLAKDAPVVKRGRKS